MRLGIDQLTNPTVVPRLGRSTALLHHCFLTAADPSGGMLLLLPKNVSLVASRGIVLLSQGGFLVAPRGAGLRLLDAVEAIDDLPKSIEVAELSKWSLGVLGGRGLRFREVLGGSLLRFLDTVGATDQLSNPRVMAGLGTRNLDAPGGIRLGFLDALEGIGLRFEGRGGIDLLHHRLLTSKDGIILKHNIFLVATQKLRVVSKMSRLLRRRWVRFRNDTILDTLIVYHLHFFVITRKNEYPI